MGTAWPQLSDRTTLAERVYEAIRERILQGQLAAGVFIREDEVGQAMGVSRTPVREAMARLASEGLLERIRHRGYRVPEESIEALLELYPIIVALEVLAARLALPRLDAADLKALRRINREYAEAREREDVQAGIELNYRFHHVISEKCGNGRLIAMLDDLRAQVVRAEMFDYSERRMHWDTSIEEHDAIVDAAEAGDLEGAVKLLEKNRSPDYDDLRARLTART